MLGAVGILALFWVPVVVAQGYDSGPGAAHVPWTRPDLGWQFAVHAAWESRNPELGSARVARRQARRLWAGPPAVADDVELAYLGGPFVVPVPDGGARAAQGRDRAVPSSRLGWRVTGSVRGGPDQMIGLLDYGSGEVLWDIRPLPEDAS